MTALALFSPPPLFLVGTVNRCPRCFGEQWHVGRLTAECAVCGDVLPISHTSSTRLPKGDK